MFKFKLLFAIWIVALQSNAALAHGGDEHAQEDLDPISSMIPLPVSVDFNGEISWGYHIDFSGNGHHGHGGHSGHNNHGDMNHDDMNHGDMNHGDMNHGDMNHGDMNHGDMNHGDMNHGDMNHGDMNHGDMNHGDMNHGDMNHGDMNHGDMNNGDMNHGDMNHGDMNNGDMNQGDMDHGDMNQDDMNHEDNSEESNMSHSSSKEWHYMIMPMITLGGDAYTKIINRTKSQTNSKVIEIDDTSAGLIAIQNRSIIVGGGAGIMAMPPIDIPMFSLKMSMMPYKGGHVFRLKQISDKSEVSTLKSMVIPDTVGDLEDWSVGDRMSYSSRGGVMFGMGAGFSILASAMKTYMAEGTWVTSVAKADDSTVFVSIRKRNMKMFGYKLMNMIVELSTSQMKHIDSNFNFLFDLSTKSGLEAYRKVLNGNILQAQELVQNKTEGVELVVHTESETTGRMRRRSYGIPYLYNVRSQAGSMLTDMKIHNGFTGEKYESHMAMYKRSVESDGIWSDHKNSGFLFMGMANKKLDTPMPRPGYAGTFKWFFQRSNTTAAYFRVQIRKLVRTFGLDGARDIVIPRLANMGFVRAELDIALKPEETRNLLNFANKKDLSLSMYNDANNSIETFLSSKDNEKAICGTKKVKTCKKRLYRGIKRATKAIPAVLVNMKNALDKNDLKAFSVNYGKLGKLMMTNRFVLQEVFKRAGKPKLKAVLKLQGSRLLETKIQL